MKCPECVGQHIHKNGHRRGRQNPICGPYGTPPETMPRIEDEHFLQKTSLPCQEYLLLHLVVLHPPLQLQAYPENDVASRH